MDKQEIFYDKGKTRPATDFEVDGDGQIILRASWRSPDFFVFGDSRVLGFGIAGAIAYDSSRIYQKGLAARAYGYDNSTVYRHGNSEIYSYCSEWDRNLVVWAPSTKIWLFDNSSFCNYRYTAAWLYDSSSIHLHCDAMVWVDTGEIVKQEELFDATKIEPFKK